MTLNVNSLLFAKSSDNVLKVLAVVPKTSRKAENLVVVADTRTDVLGRVYRVRGTERIMLQDSVRRRYNQQ